MNSPANRIGKAVCLVHERCNLLALNKLKAKLLNQAINDQTSIAFSEWNLETTYLSGKQFSITEVFVQH